MKKTSGSPSVAPAVSSSSFQFFSRLDLRELTGLKAKNIKELFEHIKEVPGSVIYHHTHHFLQQHQYLTPEPPNDFAYWVREILGFNSLGEQLASINTNEFRTIAEVRQAFVDVLGNYLKKKHAARYAAPGEEFHFIKSVTFVFPTPYVASDLGTFVDGLKKITIDSLYFHMFEAKLRLDRGSNDFSFWLETSLQEKKLADKIAALDPYTHTMEQLRQTIIRLAAARMKEKSKG